MTYFSQTSQLQSTFKSLKLCNFHLPLEALPSSSHAERPSHSPLYRHLWSQPAYRRPGQDCPDTSAYKPRGQTHTPFGPMEENYIVADRMSRRA